MLIAFSIIKPINLNQSTYVYILQLEANGVNFPTFIFNVVTCLETIRTFFIIKKHSRCVKVSLPLEVYSSLIQFIGYVLIK